MPSHAKQFFGKRVSLTPCPCLHMFIFCNMAFAASFVVAHYFPGVCEMEG